MLTNRTEQKLSKRAWGLHFGGLVIAVAGCGVMLTGVILPLRAQNAELVLQGSELRKILDFETNVTQEHERLTVVLDEADQKIKSLLDRIPNVARESDFLGQVTTLAKDVGVEIMDYHPGNVSAKEEYHEMSLTLTSQGSYEGVCDFLHRLQGLPRLSRANKLSILPLQDGATYSLNMTLTIFFSPKSKLAAEAKAMHHG